MGYYVRVFCRSTAVPTIGVVEDSLRRGFAAARFVTDEPRSSIQWSDVELCYKEGKNPVVVEINVNDGPDSLAAEECQEFIEAVGDSEPAAARARVIEHLRNTNYIVCCQLLGDIDNDGFEANGQLLDYFVARHQGLIQADGEGFHEGQDLLLELK